MKKSDDILNKIGNKNPFSVPENYFEDFSKKIAEQTAEKQVSFFEKTKPILYFAAMFAGFILIFQLLMPFTSNKTTSMGIENNLADNQTKQIEYREFLLENIDEESMIEYLLAEK